MRAMLALMLSKLDDYPVHQTCVPVSVPATTDRNSYDRYWFNGYDRDGDFYFGIALCRYPNLGILDGAFSIVRGGEQHAFHCSRRMPDEPTELTIGPLTLEILEPMGATRLVLDDNETGLAADLTLTPRTAAVEEGRQTLIRDSRAVMDSTRFAQWGRWEGEITYGGQHLPVSATTTMGTKDRSWGIRPVGDPAPPGAPPTEFTGIFFLWSPIHWEDRCTHYLVFEEPDGRQWHTDVMVVPVHDDGPPPVVDPDVRVLAGATHVLDYEPGTRRARAAHLGLVDHDGRAIEIDLEPLICFRMKGIGYTHPVWGHGMWKGELAMAGESWREEDLDPMAPENQHIQQVVRATSGGKQGIGVLEQIAFGPHHRYGFKELLDPAR
jgi:hypothetical protein